MRPPGGAFIEMRPPGGAFIEMRPLEFRNDSFDYSCTRQNLIVWDRRYVPCYWQLISSACQR